jgi:hemolysin-activating ACP:hemolysin acyltransferase
MVYLMTRNPVYGRFPVVVVRLHLEPAVLVEQCRIFYDDRGMPIGYVTWAHLAKDVHDRVVADRDYVLKLSEWCEGEHLWVRDFFSLPGYALTVAREAIREIRPLAPIHYHRRRQGQKYCSRRVARLWEVGHV